jgi:hypothetical protein
MLLVKLVTFDVALLQQYGGCGVVPESDRESVTSRVLKACCAQVGERGQQQATDQEADNHQEPWSTPLSPVDYYHSQSILLSPKSGWKADVPMIQTA